MNRSINWLNTSDLRLLEARTLGPHGSPDPFELWLLMKLAEDAKHGILEIGTWQGRSACFLAKNAQVPLVCVDHFKGDETGGAGASLRATVETFRRHHVTAVVTEGDMLTFDWSSMRAPDLVFYDADHDTGPTVATLTALHPHLVDHARVVIHDADFPTSCPAIARLISSGLYRLVTTLNIWEGLAILQKNPAPACLAVLAHTKAQATVTDFLPQWKKLGLPIYALLPEGDAIEGDFTAVIHAGVSAYSGRPIFERWTASLEALLKLPFDVFHIIEYDTVNLTPAVLPFDPGKLNAYCCKDGDAYCLLSPWIMDRATLTEFHDACLAELRSGDPVPDHVMGLLDRWLGHVCRRQKIQCAIVTRTLSYTGHADWFADVGKDRVEWVHGRKHKADFGDLWPQE